MRPSQPLFEITLTRPWHWGIAMIFDPGGDAPDVNPQDLVSLGPSGMVILVRHAQDSIESFDGDRDWATASLHVRLLVATEPVPRAIACDAMLQTPSGRLELGDADEYLTISVDPGRIRGGCLRKRTRRTNRPTMCGSICWLSMSKATWWSSATANHHGHPGNGSMRVVDGVHSAVCWGIRVRLVGV